MAAKNTERRFLALMSHEIRTPLGALVGFLELLQETELSAVQASTPLPCPQGARGTAPRVLGIQPPGY